MKLFKIIYLLLFEYLHLFENKISGSNIFLQVDRSKAENPSNAANGKGIATLASVAQLMEFSHGEIIDGVVDDITEDVSRDVIDISPHDMKQNALEDNMFVTAADFEDISDFTEAFYDEALGTYDNTINISISTGGYSTGISTPVAPDGVNDGFTYDDIIIYQNQSLDNEVFYNQPTTKSLGLIELDTFSDVSNDAFESQTFMFLESPDDIYIVGLFPVHYPANDGE